MAIKINIKKAEQNYDPGTSKFFGSPTVPSDMLDIYNENEIFFCQINIQELKHLDKDNILPDTGYIYIFLDTTNSKYNLISRVIYKKEEPTHILDEFNKEVESFSEYVTPYIMTFEECDDYENCTRLFGYPNDWNYQDEPRKLFMQFDPLDNEIGFLDSLDGLLYFFFNKEFELSSIELHEEYS